MAPDERAKALAKLPKDRQEKVREQLRRYDQLTPAQREQLEWFNHLPQDRQASFRNAFQRFQAEAPDRQVLMREELQQLRSLPEPDRRARLAGPEFRSKYNASEQKILSDMAELLPSQ